MNPSIPFRCAAFSITSRKSGGFIRKERWLVEVRDLDRDAVSSTHRHDKYDEDDFRGLAALSGWRLVNIVPASDNERWLYFVKAW